MPDPKENESEVLSTDELKGVSGGVLFLNGFKVNGPEGAGCGTTLDDYKRSVGVIVDNPSLVSTISRLSDDYDFRD